VKQFYGAGMRPPSDSPTVLAATARIRKLSIGDEAGFEALPRGGDSPDIMAVKAAESSPVIQTRSLLSMRPVIRSRRNKPGSIEAPACPSVNTTAFPPNTHDFRVKTHITDRLSKK
jgi:hypothetical protein